VCRTGRQVAPLRAGPTLPGVKEAVCRCAVCGVWCSVWCRMFSLQVQGPPPSSQAGAGVGAGGVQREGGLRWC